MNTKFLNKKRNKKFQSTAGSAVFFTEVILYHSSERLQSLSNICQRLLNLVLTSVVVPNPDCGS
jgi:hypothetical protein